MLNFGYGLDFFEVCHHPDKLGDHGHCESGNMSLIYHMTSRDMLKGLCSRGSISC